VAVSCVAWPASGKRRRNPRGGERRSCRRRQVTHDTNAATRTAPVGGWSRYGHLQKDTGVAAHTKATAGLGVDVYVAGVVHAPDELEEQNARGLRIATICEAYVAYASSAGPAGGGDAAELHASQGASRTRSRPQPHVQPPHPPAAGEGGDPASDGAPRAQHPLHPAEGRYGASTAASEMAQRPTTPSPPQHQLRTSRTRACIDQAERPPPPQDGGARPDAARHGPLGNKIREQEAAGVEQ
jgi:hypothetical protein